MEKEEIEQPKKFKWWLPTIIVVVVIGAIVGLSLWQNHKANEKQTVKIGFVAPQSGDAASYGEYATKAFKLAIENFNAENKKVNFDVVYEDGKCDGTAAASAINKLISTDGVKYVIGGLCSSETLAMAPIAEQNKVILFTPGSGSPDITNAGDYIFRNLVSDDFTAKEIAKIAIKNSDMKMGIISENIDYPQTLNKAFNTYYTSNGGTVALDEKFETGTTDFRTIITKAKSQNLTSIYLITQSYKTSALILQQMKELNFTPKIYTSESTISAEAMNYYDASYKGLLENAIFTQPKFDESNPKTADVLAKFKAKYGTTEGPIPTSYIATYWDSVYLIGEAIEKGGNTPDQVKNYFYNNIKNWQGAIGTFSFDSNGDAVTGVDAKTVKNGQIVPLEQ